MEDISPAEKQRREKYRDHDFHLDDFKSYETDVIRSQAIQGYVETKESDNVRLIVLAFMGFLTSKGYKIVKKDKT